MGGKSGGLPPRQCQRCTGDGSLPCEHDRKHQHPVTSGPETGRICQPPDCNHCRGHGHLYQ